MKALASLLLIAWAVGWWFLTRASVEEFGRALSAREIVSRQPYEVEYTERGFPSGPTIKVRFDGPDLTDQLRVTVYEPSGRAQRVAAQVKWRSHAETLLEAAVGFPGEFCRVWTEGVYQCVVARDDALIVTTTEVDDTENHLRDDVPEWNDFLIRTGLKHYAGVRSTIMEDANQTFFLAGVLPILAIPLVWSLVASVQSGQRGRAGYLE